MEVWLLLGAPWRVRLSVAGGGFFGRLGRRPGLGGEGGSGGVDTSSSPGMMAGFKREMFTFSEGAPGIAILKDVSCRSTTLYGPM